MQSNYFYLWVLGLLLAPATVKGGNMTVTDNITMATVLSHRNEDGDFNAATTSSMASTSTTLHLSNTTDMQYNHTTIDKTPASNATLGVNTVTPGGALSRTATPSSESGKTTGYVALVFLLLAIIFLIVIILLIRKKSRI